MSGGAVAYLRVSTAKQGGDGLGVAAQRKAIADWALRCGYTVDQEFVEIESGRRSDRPVALRAIEAARGSGATLVVAKLDRLTREATMLALIQEKRVKFVVVDNPTANELTIDILAAFAREEVRAISTRTRAALAAKKARGEKLGRPENLTQEGRLRGARVVRERAINAYAGMIPYVLTMARELGLGPRQIAARLNAEGFRTVTGVAFTQPIIWRILRRLKYG